MPGRGPAPKDPSQRRRANIPESGEWVFIPPLEKPVLPNAHRDWTPRVKRLWKAWRADPVTQMYSASDLAAIYDLADVFERIKESEQRLRMIALGLTPQGRQARHWRLMTEVPPAGLRDDGPKGEPQQQGATVTRLHVVAPESEAS